MNPMIDVELGPVQETLLIPLLGRAVETQKKKGILRDPKAVEIVSQLDYDFDKWKGTRSLLGASLRTRIFDEMVSDFLRAHPQGTVVEIGAGLNTRFERLDNGKARWLELDLPDSMALRQRFFAENERRTMMATDVLEDEWREQLSEYPAPYCFVSEAVLIYLVEEQVEPLMRDLATRFPGSTLIMDTTAAAMVNAQATHDAMSKLSMKSWFKWACDDPAGLEAWGLKLEESRTFMDAPPALVADLPLSLRLVLRFTPWLLRRKTETYRLNQFRLVATRSASAGSSR